MRQLLLGPVAQLISHGLRLRFFKFAVKTCFIIDSTYKLEIKRVDINGREN